MVDRHEMCTSLFHFILPLNFRQWVFSFLSDIRLKKLLTIFNYLTNFRYFAGSDDEALVKAERALEIEEKELGARDEQMAGLYRLRAHIWAQVKVALIKAIGLTGNVTRQ